MIWDFDDYNREVAVDLQSFLPSKVFDAHAHPCEKSELDTDRIEILSDLPNDVAIAA